LSKDTPALITAHGVELRFGARVLLHEATFRVAPGDRIGLVGRNGAGKTTLTKTLAGDTLPTGGKITRGTDIGYLPQDFACPKNVTVTDYLRFVAWARSSRRRRLSDSDVAEALDRVGLSDRAGARIGTLSGGMVRRLGVGQALLGRSEVIVLDEPTVGLDPVQRRELRDLLRTLGADTTILLSTHLSEDVAAVATAVDVLHQGRIEMTGTVQELVARGPAGPVSGDTVEQGFLAVVGAVA